jgi:hypothetical protein
VLGGGFYCCGRRSSEIPTQQLVNPIYWMLGDTREHFAQRSARQIEPAKRALLSVCLRMAGRLHVDHQSGE